MNNAARGTKQYCKVLLDGLRLCSIMTGHAHLTEQDCKLGRHAVMYAALGLLACRVKVPYAGHL